MSDLKYELQTISGVGEATAEKIIEIVEGYDTGSDAENVETAIEYIEAGRPGYAMKYLRRVVD